jgi:hypothetical protein
MDRYNSLKDILVVKLTTVVDVDKNIQVYYDYKSYKDVILCMHIHVYVTTDTCYYD